MPQSLSIIGRLREVFVGMARPFTRPGSRSGIHKLPATGPVAVSVLGLQGDEQGDSRVHGGQDKAVHCYPWSHYEAWLRELTTPFAIGLLQGNAAAFGENFSVDPGLDESTVCLADRWVIGDATFEVVQGRQPCWKLNDRFGVADMALRVQQSGRCGWYIRVMNTGQVRAGDAIYLAARPYPEWPLGRLMRAIAERNQDPDLLAEILRLPLPPSWEKLFRGRMTTGQIENWQLRLRGNVEQ
jgi:MOSC domain-containing protein YiiM